MRVSSHFEVAANVRVGFLGAFLIMGRQVENQRAFLNLTVSIFSRCISYRTEFLFIEIPVLQGLRFHCSH